ncbi:hypothetical protein [Amycolatopsis sp. NBC_01286]|nr:hypothetical protein OG570_32885 [Amycolatopsis sp. NBC_01286]
MTGMEADLTYGVRQYLVDGDVTSRDVTVGKWRWSARGTARRPQFG